MRNHASLQKLVKNGLVWSAEEPEKENSSFTACRRPLIQTGKLLAAEKTSRAARLSVNDNSINDNSANDNRTGCFGITEIDSILPEGGLAAGTLHEFSLIQTMAQSSGSGLRPAKSSINDSFCPHTIPSVLAAGVIKNIVKRKILADNYTKELFLNDSKDAGQLCRRFAVWIGKSCWPTAFLLQVICSISFGNHEKMKEISLLNNCLFINPRGRTEKLWCLEHLLASPAAAVVVAELERSSFALSRKFSLLAQKSQAVGILIRPENEIRSSSAALTKWTIRPVVSESDNPNWELQLIKCRGRYAGQRRWILEQSEDGSLNYVSGKSGNLPRMPIDSDYARAGQSA